MAALNTVADIKVLLKELTEPRIILTDNISEEQIYVLAGKMFEDKRVRILVHSTHKKHVKKVLQKHPKVKLETGNSARWSVPEWKGTFV